MQKTVLSLSKCLVWLCRDRLSDLIWKAEELGNRGIVWNLRRLPGRAGEASWGPIEKGGEVKRSWERNTEGAVCKNGGRMRPEEKTEKFLVERIWEAILVTVIFKHECPAVLPYPGGMPSKTPTGCLKCR